MSRLLVPTTSTQSDRDGSLNGIMNHAKRRFKELKPALPSCCASITEEQFVAIYMVAHVDIRDAFAKGIALHKRNELHLVH